MKVSDYEMEESKKALEEYTINTEKNSISTIEKAKSIDKSDKDNPKNVIIKGPSFKICNSTPEDKKKQQNESGSYSCSSDNFLHKVRSGKENTVR